MRLRIRDITRQICAQLGVTIIKGALSSYYVHMFVEDTAKSIRQRLYAASQRLYIT